VRLCAVYSMHPLGVCQEHGGLFPCSLFSFAFSRFSCFRFSRDFKEIFLQYLYVRLAH